MKSFKRCIMHSSGLRQRKRVEQRRSADNNEFNEIQNALLFAKVKGRLANVCSWLFNTHLINTHRVRCIQPMQLKLFEAIYLNVFVVTFFYFYLQPFFFLVQIIRTI